MVMLVVMVSISIVMVLEMDVDNGWRARIVGLMRREEEIETEQQDKQLLHALAPTSSQRNDPPTVVKRQRLSRWQAAALESTIVPMPWRLPRANVGTSP